MSQLTTSSQPHLSSGMPDLQPPEVHAARAVQALRDEARSLSKVVTTLRPLTNPAAFQNNTKFDALLSRLQQKVATAGVAAPRGQALISEIRTQVDAARLRQREALYQNLKRATEAQGLALRVVSREDPIEVRIPPFAVKIHRERGTAELLFARYPVATCPADAGEILAAHRTALSEIQEGFDAAGFHFACRKAWLAARGAGEAGQSDRVEILAFLPYLAMQLQRPAFNVEPSNKNFRGYTRARFAFDLLQLRKGGQLAHDGWRLNLGVATGATASKKSRVIWLEDEDGRGEFKLTVFFTRSEEPS